MASAAMLTAKLSCCAVCPEVPFELHVQLQLESVKQWAAVITVVGVTRKPEQRPSLGTCKLTT